MKANQGIYAEFKKACLRRFQSLAEAFQFKIAKKEKEPFGIFVTFQNQTTAIRVSFEPREGGIFVLLSRLVDGRIPPYPIFIKPDMPLHSFYLDDLISLRAPEFHFNFRRHNLSSPDQLDEALAEVASALQRYAADVLNGNFVVFNELDRVVKMRRQALNRRGKEP